MILDQEISILHLSAGTTSLVLDFHDNEPVEVLYWGKCLGNLSSYELGSLPTLVKPAISGNSPDKQVRVPLVPQSSYGWAGRPGIVGNRENGSGWSPIFKTIAVEVIAQDMHTDADMLTMGAGIVIFELEDKDNRLGLQLEIELFDSGFFRSRAKLINYDESDYNLAELSIAMPLPLDANEILDFTGRWGQEREPIRVDVQPGCHLHEGRHGRTGFDAAMMMFSGAKGFDFQNGQVWGLHVGFSGNHRTWVERCINGKQVIGGGELLMPGEITLQQNESYQTPWIYLGQGQGLDAVAHMAHRWLRALPTHPGDKRPVTLNVWEAVYFDQNLEKLYALAEKAAAVGVERFVLDDGWFLKRRNDFAGLGDWYVDPDIWPTGLHPLVNKVHDLGMEFGLWFEPEMVNIDSNVARNHPDWIMRSNSSMPVEWRHQQVLNLAIPEAYNYVFTRIDDLVKEYGITYLKWDHNRDLVDAGDATKFGKAGIHQQTLACYRMMDQLKESNQSLEIESCSSGGGRIDLEIARHVDRFWVSDCIDPHERQRMMRWTQQIIPPEMLGSHIASALSETTGRSSQLSFRAATALWGHLGIEWDISDIDKDELSELTAWISFYKQHRQLLFNGNIVRADVSDGSVWLNGVVDRKAENALFAIVTRKRSPLSPRGQVKIPGLQDNKRYRIVPKFIGSKPSGFVSPPWLDLAEKQLVLSGKILRLVGINMPVLFPDQAIILEVKYVEDFEK